MFHHHGNETNLTAVSAVAKTIITVAIKAMILVPRTHAN